jgi:hypothetical protein
MRRTWLPIAASYLVFALAVASAESVVALPVLLPDVELGASQEDVERSLGQLLPGLELLRLDATSAQHLAAGLADTELLSMLNRANARYTLLQKPAERGVRILTGAKDGIHFVLASAEDRLEAALFFLPVPVDRTVGSSENPFHVSRLSRIRELLRTLAARFQLTSVPAPQVSDLRWTGAWRNARVLVEYRPFEDRVVLLVHL